MVVTAHMLLETVRLSQVGLKASLFKDLVLTAAKVDAYRGGTAHTVCVMLLLILSQPASSFSFGISSAVGSSMGLVNFSVCLP